MFLRNAFPDKRKIVDKRGKFSLYSCVCKTLVSFRKIFILLAKIWNRFIKKVLLVYVNLFYVFVKFQCICKIAVVLVNLCKQVYLQGAYIYAIKFDLFLEAF